MLVRNFFAGLLAVVAVASAMPGPAAARDIPIANNVVLVHGLYADGSSWIDVIAYLQRAGLHVTAVWLPRTVQPSWLATPLPGLSSAKPALIPRFRRSYT